MTDPKPARSPHPEEDAQKDCRRHRRFPCSEGTHFLTRRRLHEGTIKNFSRGGTYIETDGFFFAGQEITVAGPFEVDGKEAKQKGAIVRCDGRGIGVKFAKPIP
jgi:hypothetical protein